MADDMLDFDKKDLLSTVNQADMTTWSHEKRKDFSDLFEKRSRAAQYIMQMTARYIAETAHRRKFVSNLHISRLDRQFNGFSVRRYGDVFVDIESHGHNFGRGTADLQKIAQERAAKVLTELPQLSKAVRIIDKEIADKIELVEKLKVKGQSLVEKLDELSGKISLSEVDQKMTIGDFRKMVKDREKKRSDLAHQLNEIGKEGVLLNRDIDAALYKGLPGLSDAILKSVITHVERAMALEETTRRIVEKIQFGDCKEAMELLSIFEKDELKVSEEVQAEFKQALEKLKLSKKALPRKAGK
jgi:hypothetical protein